MKYSILILFIICNYSIFAQLENYATDNADTTYTASHKIKQIAFKSILDELIGIANFAYYENDTLKSIDYKDKEGFAQYGYNRLGTMNVIHYDHPLTGKIHTYYAYKYYEDGNVLSLSKYDSAKVMLSSEKYTYNAEGRMDSALNYNSAGELSNTWILKYDSEGNSSCKESIGYPGLRKFISISASISEDGEAFNCRYIYNSDHVLERLYVTTIKENGDDDEETVIHFNHKKGKLKTFALETNDSPVKVKKKHLDNRWIKEYYAVSARNIEIQTNN